MTSKCLCNLGILFVMQLYKVIVTSNLCVLFSKRYIVHLKKFTKVNEHFTCASEKQIIDEIVSIFFLFHLLLSVCFSHLQDIYTIYKLL